MTIHSEQRPALPSPCTATPRSPLRILLAEDNVINQKVALKQLQTLGYQADAVSNGQKAVEAVTQSRTPYDLVLMDCQMPVTDGYEATQAIRAWETALVQRGRVVVIAMTASDLLQDRERAIAVGMDDFVSKPIRIDALATLLRRWNQVIGHSQTHFAASETSSTGYPASIDPEFFQSHLDLEHLHVLSDDSPEFELELLQLFTQDCANSLGLLQGAIAIHDLHQVERTAHYLKGASANVGAKAMHAAAERLERQARQNQMLPDGSLEALAASLRQINQFVEYLRSQQAC